MYLIHKTTHEKQLCEIKPISDSLLKRIAKKSFSFDWLELTEYDIFALNLQNEKKIVGLMALKNVPDELRIEIVLLEASKENVGEHKEYERIAGCLIAFACRQSFLKGYSGFVSLVPKTRLIPHYMNAYGFQQFGRQLASNYPNSQQLIKKYLSNEE
ncbi:MAG: hypothetical protein U5L45_13715 [Saprospiraceae bacterium]|nr:hypothetical protein [Saprospiraceae bacterium]